MSMMNQENEQLELFYKRAKRLVERIREEKDFLSRCGYTFLNTTNKASQIISLLAESAQFCADFKELRSGKEEGTNVNPLGVHRHSKVDNVSSVLSIIEEAINQIVDLIEIKIKPNLSVNEKHLLEGLRKDLEVMKLDELNEDIYKNLGRAIIELEAGNHLTCSMISAKVTNYAVQRIEGKEVKDKINKLTDLQVIASDEKSKQSSKFFLDAENSSRNFALHDLGSFPGETEANKYLSSSMIMAKLYTQYQKALKKTKNN